MPITAITINVNNTILANAITALASKVGWTAQVDDGTGTGTLVANPVTQAQAAKQRLINHVLNDITDYNNAQAQAAVVPPAPNLLS